MSRISTEQLSTNSNTNNQNMSQQQQDPSLQPQSLLGNFNAAADGTPNVAPSSQPQSTGPQDDTTMIEEKEGEKTPEKPQKNYTITDFIRYNEKTIAILHNQKK